MKKTLALILALCLVFGIACIGHAEDDANRTNWLCDEKTTLTVCTYDGVSAAFATIGNDLRFWQWLEDYTNVHIEWEVHSNADYSTVVAAKLASGSIDTDIFCGPNMAQIIKAAEAGMIVNISDYPDCLPNTFAYAETEYPAYLDSMTATDGNMYCLGGSVHPYLGHIVFNYNTAWLKQLGREVPTTLDEFTDLLRAMKGVDFNGNGEADEIPLTASGLYAMDILGNSFGLENYEGTPEFAVDENGKVFDDMTTERNRDFYRYLHMLYEEGLLDPSITSTSADDMSQKIAKDQVGVFIYYSWFAIGYGQLCSAGQEDPMGEHYSVGGPLKGPNGEDSFFMLRNRACTDETVVSANSEHIELAIRWLDTLINDPWCITIRTHGWPGEHWDGYDEKGEPINLLDENGEPFDISALGCNQIAMPHHQTITMLTGCDPWPWYVEEYYKLLEPFAFKAPSFPTNVPAYTPEEQDEFDMYQSDVMNYFKEMRAKFIVGEASIEDEWDAYVDTMNSLGLQEYTAAMQMVYDRVTGE